MLRSRSPRLPPRGRIDQHVFTFDAHRVRDEARLRRNLVDAGRDPELPPVDRADQEPARHDSLRQVAALVQARALGREVLVAVADERHRAAVDLDRLDLAGAQLALLRGDVPGHGRSSAAWMPYSLILL